MNRIIRKNPDRAFTLAEVLAVLCIIVLLVVIAQPILARTREDARQSSCVAAIRHLNMALTLYTGDYDGTYPAVTPATFVQTKPHESQTHSSHTPNFWCTAVMPYLGGTIARCPEVTAEVPPGTDRCYTFTYALNFFLSDRRVQARVARPDTNTLEGIDEGRVRYPSLTVALAEARLGIMSVGSPDDKHHYRRRINLFDIEAFTNSQPSGATRHHGGANYAFVDGHAKWFKPEQLESDPVSAGLTPGFGL